MKVLINLLVLISATLAGLLICLSLYTFYISVRPTKIISSINPSQYNLTYEKVYFSSSDGVILAGWYLPKKGTPTRKALILAHGYPADKGDIFPAFYFLNEEYNLFFFDFRYHGESGGNYTTIGGKEVQDLLSAVTYLKELGMEKIGVVGFSMGGAVGLMSLSQTNEIDLVVSDSAYARLDLMAQELYRPLKGLRVPLVFLTDIWSRLILRQSLKSVSPMDLAAKSQVPILQIHSQDDSVIPFSQAKLLQQALKENSKSEFYFRTRSDHGMMDEEYKTILENFLKKNL